jgi:hypothetical protein
MTQPTFLSSKPGYTVGVGVYSSSIILRHHHISDDIYYSITTCLNQACFEKISWN